MSETKAPISEIQDEIVEDFSLLSGDLESTIFYIMELGQKLPVMDASLKTEEHLVKGCQSKVWLSARFKDGKVFFTADSNTEITKGLISLLIRIWNGRSPKEILESELYFIDKIGMSRVIGSQRSNGFASMIQKMRGYALGFSQFSNPNGN